MIWYLPRLAYVGGFAVFTWLGYEVGSYGCDEVPFVGSRWEKFLYVLRNKIPSSIWLFMLFMAFFGMTAVIKFLKKVV